MSLMATISRFGVAVLSRLIGQDIVALDDVLRDGFNGFRVNGQACDKST